jgi:hypothetical protein
MLKSGYDILPLVINFINQAWIPCHITIGLFETLNIPSVVLIEEMKVLLVEFNLTNKVVVYVKDEGINLNFLTIVFIVIV